MINWPGVPELEEFEATADHIIIAGYYGTGGLTATSGTERAQPYEMLADEMRRWARMVRKMLDSVGPPANVAQAETVASKEVDIFATIKSKKRLCRAAGKSCVQVRKL